MRVAVNIIKLPNIPHARWVWSGGLNSPVLHKDKVQLGEHAWEAERMRKRREWERKSSVRWPHSDNRPGKSLSLEPFRNSTVVYTGGGWVEQDMEWACILQHLIMNTKHMQHVKSHRHTHIQVLYPWSKVWLEFRFSCDIFRVCVIFLGHSQCIPLCLNFKVKFLCAVQELSNTTILGYRPVSARLLERRPLVGSCVWLRGCLLQQHPLGQSSAPWKATIAQRWLPRPLFMQQHTTARLKGKEQDSGEIFKAAARNADTLSFHLHRTDTASF